MSTDTFPAQTSAAPDEVFPSAAVRARGRIGLKELAAGRWGVLGALAAMLLVSAWLRTRGIHFYYWIDEGLSVGIASHPLLHIPSLLKQDGSPPLYYMVLHVWMGAFGRGEVSTHLLSLLFGLLAIPVSYWAGRSLFDRRAGLICAVLAAGLPYLTQYAQETRMYALLTLLCLIASAAFVHAFVLRHRRYLAVFSVSLAGALYTHNWGLFFALMAAVAFLVCVACTPPGERRGLWRDGAIGFGIVLILYAPWVPTLIYQAGHTGAPWDPKPVFWSLTQALYSIVGGRGGAVAVLLGGGSGLVALYQLSSRRGLAAFRERHDRQPLLLASVSLLILGLGTLVTAWVYSKHSPAWAWRYLAAIVGPLLLVSGLGLARSGKLGLFSLVLLVGFWVLTPVSHSLSGKSNVGKVIPELRAQLGSDPLVLSTQPEQVPTIDYYLAAPARYVTPMGRVPDPRVVDWRNALARMERSSVRTVLMPAIGSLRPGERLVLVVPVDLADTPLYLDLIDRYSVEWTLAIRHDRSLKMIATSDRDAPGSGTGVRATVFELRS